MSELLEHLVVAAEVPDTRTSQSVVRAARRSPAELESERGNLDAALDETQQRLAEVQSIHVQEAHMLPILREPTTMPACSARHSERATKRDPPRDNPRDTLTAEI